MSSFDVLLIAHLVGDYLLQLGWMAANKTKSWLATFTHAAVYTLTVAAFAVLFIKDFSAWGLVLVFVSHAIIDRRVITAFWVKSVMSAPESERGWLTIVVDQIFHLIILFMAINL
ncbi:MAG: DUF3307 domain-containing protein [Thermincola sp.]|jgi:hypothetical protein|nr:DUF3307 domain-containing protein [Thermincola sp.]MDT3701967.1 DUF3307 domain-containing protein [Thermincola sp.]